jgi:hypothetical protein
MTTFTYRSHPLKTISTVHKSKGRSTADATCRRQIVTNILPGAVVDANLPPSNIKSWVMKRLHPKMKMNTDHQSRGTSTHHHVLRQELYISKRLPATQKKGNMTSTINLAHN